MDHSVVARNDASYHISFDLSEEMFKIDMVA